MLKKRILPLLAVTVLGTTLLASCSGGAPAGDSNFIIWATDAEIPVINAILEDYNATATEKIDYKVVPVSESDAGTNLAKDPLVTGAPALVLAADDQLNNLVNLNIIESVPEEYAARVRALNTEVSVTAATYKDNQIFGFPVTNDNGYFLWYDKEAFKGNESKLDSLEGILSLCETKKKKMLMDVGNGWYANSFIMSPQAAGVTSMQWKTDSEGKIYYETNWDDDKYIPVHEYIASLLGEAYSTKGTILGGGNDKVISGFQDGSLIAAVSGTWMQADLEAALGSADRLGACKLPTYSFDGKDYQMTTFTGSKVYVVNSFLPDLMDKAHKVADILTNSKEAQLKRFELRQSIPCNKEALEDSRYLDHKTTGGAALEATLAVGSCVQSTTAETRYWDVGATIGKAYFDGDLGDVSNWKEFLSTLCDGLRKAK